MGEIKKEKKEKKGIRKEYKEVALPAGSGVFLLYAGLGVEYISDFCTGYIQRKAE